MSNQVKNNTGTLNLNVYEDKGKFVEGSTLAELFDGSIELNPETEDNSDNWPELKGRMRINGINYYISAWLKTGNDYEFISLAFKEVEEKTKKSAKNTEKKSPRGKKVTGKKSRYKDDDDFDDDIPF